MDYGWKLPKQKKKEKKVMLDKKMGKVAKGAKNKKK
jgi:hypothetical protein